MLRLRQILLQQDALRRVVLQQAALSGDVVFRLLCLALLPQCNSEVSLH